MTSAPLPPTPPYQASVAAAASLQSPAAIAMLQAENAQSAAAGMPLSGAGMTRPPALGVPAPDSSPTDLAAELGLTPAGLTSFAVDYLVFVEGNVHEPGPYLAEGGTSLATALNAAGGLNLTADLSAITVTSNVIDSATGASRTVRNQYRGANMADFEKIALQPQDTVIVRQVFSDRESGTVMVVGAVRYPGTFDILRNEHLSSILARAGGLTDEAYPLGAVFTRISAQQAEAQGNYREAIELQSGALAAATTPNVNSQILPYLQTLEQQLLKQPALGRITVTADPTILAVKPELETPFDCGRQWRSAQSRLLPIPPQYVGGRLHRYGRRLLESRRGRRDLHHHARRQCAYSFFEHAQFLRERPHTARVDYRRAAQSCAL
jgi:protein involved in polysaccharide export with SLBB domain